MWDDCSSLAAGFCVSLKQGPPGAVSLQQLGGPSARLSLPLASMAHAGLAEQFLAPQGAGGEGVRAATPSLSHRLPQG